MEQDDYVYPGQRFTENGFCTGHGQGMTLRDWFAGQALQGMLAAKSVYHFDTASAEAYSAADAMLEARKK